MSREELYGPSPDWLNDTDWLVLVVPLHNPPNWETADSAHLGRLLAFCVATDTRLLGQMSPPDETACELWFSFNSEERKREFLQLVREDGYVNPDEEHCFFRPPSLEDLKDILPLPDTLDGDAWDAAEAIVLSIWNRGKRSPRKL